MSGGRRASITRVAVTATDVLSTSVSGRGLRAIGIAGALASHFQVTLICGGDPGSLVSPAVEVAVSPEELAARQLVARDAGGAGRRPGLR
jgi:hypothetical protein